MGKNHDSISYKLRLKINFRDCFSCRYCGKRMNPLDDDIEIDHIDPLGDNNELNLVTACKRCNVRKNNRHARQFMAQRANEIEAELAGVDLSPASPGIFPPMLQRRSKKEPLREVLTRTAIECDVSVEDIIVKDNRAHSVAARRQFCSTARMMGYSLPEIGRTIRRHHTSVLHLVSTVGHVDKNAKYTLVGKELTETVSQYPKIAQAQQQQVRDTLGSKDS
jgi:Bacterial dnaA protein helix-turn-helix/HNH endonuclease